jgi:hypothetical protein
LYEELQEVSKSSKADHRPRSGKVEELRGQLDKVCVELADVKNKNSKTEEFNARLRFTMLSITVILSHIFNDFLCHFY